MKPDWAKIEREVNAAIDAATWTSIPGPRDAEAYQGTAPGAVFTVVCGDPRAPGSLGYDGAVAFSRGVVVRLTREQAERAVQKARG